MFLKEMQYEGSDEFRHFWKNVWCCQIELLLSSDPYFSYSDPCSRSTQACDRFWVSEHPVLASRTELEALPGTSAL